MGQLTHLEDLGPIDIIVRSFQIFWNHAKTFLTICLAYGVPTAVLSVGFEIALIVYQQQIMPQPPDPSPPLTVHMTATASRAMNAGLNSPHNLYDSMKMDTIRPSGSSGFVPSIELFDGFYTLLEFNVWYRFYFSFILFQLFISATTIGLQVIQALPISTTLVTVEFADANKEFSFRDVVETAIPRLWKLLVVTQLCIQGIVQSMAVLYIVLSIWSSYLGAPTISLILSAVLLVFSFYMAVINSLAVGVSILEEVGGWVALKEAKRLLQGRFTIALCVQLLYYIPGGLVVWTTFALMSQLAKDPWCPSTYLLVFAQVALSSILGQLTTVCNGVCYLSFKAYHQTVPSHV